jgi:hypothetical protein
MDAGPDDSDFDRSKAEMFEALGHPLRIKLLGAMKDGPVSFSELKKKTGIESSGHLTFHLDKLDGFIRTTSEGNYALSNLGVEALALLERVGPRSLAQEEPWRNPVRATGALSVSSDVPPGAAHERQKKYMVALVVIVALVVVGAAALYVSATAEYTVVTLDFTGTGNQFGWNVYNNASPPLLLDISVNGSLVVHMTSASVLPPTLTQYYSYLPHGLVVAQGSMFNVTVDVSYSEGSTLVKSVMLKGLTSTTLRLSG